MIKLPFSSGYIIALSVLSSITAVKAEGSCWWLSSVLCSTHSSALCSPGAQWCESAGETPLPSVTAALPAHHHSHHSLTSVYSEPFCTTITAFCPPPLTMLFGLLLTILCTFLPPHKLKQNAKVQQNDFFKNITLAFVTVYFQFVYIKSPILADSFNLKSIFTI